MIKGSNFFLVYLCGFLLAVHYASVAYVNSSLLEQSVGNQVLGTLYILGSVFGIALLALSPYLVRSLGNVATLILFASLEILAVFGLGSVKLAFLVGILFLIHQAAESMLYFSLDVELEERIKKEGVTGGKRGAYLTAQNIAWVLSPLVLSFLLRDDDLSNAYILSGIALLPLLFITFFSFKRVKETKGKESHIVPAFRSFMRFGDQSKIIWIQFILNFFFSWMIIYLPLALREEIGFDWSSIGKILTVMLIPYIIFELPTGILADRKTGEKEVLTIGIVIIAFFTFFIPFLETTSLLVWALILFMTRIGAAIVEISSESYFFKHVNEMDTGSISLFRMARPFSFVLAPLLSIGVLQFTDYRGSFLFLALFVLLGLFFIPKRDTR